MEWHSDTEGDLIQYLLLFKLLLLLKKNINFCIRSSNWKDNLCHANGDLYTSRVSLQFFFYLCFVPHKDSFQNETFSCSKTWLESLTIQSLHKTNGAKQTGAQRNLANQSGNSPTHPFMHSPRRFLPVPFILRVQHTACRGPARAEPSLGNKREGNPQHRCRCLCYTALCGLMTDNRPVVVDPGGA